MSLPAPRAAVAASAQARIPRRSAVFAVPSRASANKTRRIESRKPRERRAAAVFPTASATSSTSTSSSLSPSSSSSSAPLAPNAARLRTLSGCGLRISVYPPFSYDASGGVSVGTVGGGEGGSEGGSEGGGEGEGGAKKSSLSFDPSAISIPALDSRTTKFLGLPLPPGLRIGIEPLKLSGWVRRDTGEVSLDFEARFRFTAFGLYRPPPLFVSATLTTGEATGRSSEKGAPAGSRLSGRGDKLRENGRVVLSGVAVVEPVGDFFLDSFLMLPTECLAELKAELELGDS